MPPRSLSRLVAFCGVGSGIRYRLAGKTLIELLIVLAIIAVLLGLFLPVVHMAWKAVDRLR
jgi:prepilin-type N-terminal cleavage/methylation domain-containing protein